jgi:hypothetical protein
MKIHGGEIAVTRKDFAPGYVRTCEVRIEISCDVEAANALEAFYNDVLKSGKVPTKEASNA